MVIDSFNSVGFLFGFSGFDLGSCEFHFGGINFIEPDNAPIQK